MSLLLDALKRAEQEKLARGGAEAAAAPQAVPHAAPRAVAAVPPPSLELQPIGGAQAKADAAAHAAQVVFQAKTAANAPAEPERKMGMVWATIGAIAVVAIAAGAYVWYSINALTPKAAAYTPRPAAAPVPPPGSSAMPTSAAVAQSALLAQAPPAPQPAVSQPIPPAPAAAAAPAAADPSPARAPTAASSVEALLRESAPAAAPPLRMDRTAEAPRRVPAAVSAGYEALRQGDVAEARRSYEAALAGDPANADARLGLATAEARLGNHPAAAHHYRRVLEGDPRNATALAGLAALADFTRPDVLESQLRAQVDAQPGSAALHFTLGTLFASQRRWHDAQAEFFEAHRIEPGAADILFNLAVSLDNLGQSRVAADFYARALAAARTQPSQFDPAAASRRLAEIR